MNEISVFKNPELGSVRTLMINNIPWFAGCDVARALGYVNTRDAIIKHVDKEDQQIIRRSQITTFEIPPRGLTFISETGLYSLAFGSKMECAKKFTRWVTCEVLPSIRKTGSYSVEKPQSDVECVVKGVLAARRLLKERNKQIEELKTKADFADAISTSDTSIPIGALAKLIKQNGVDIGRNRLFAWMKDRGYLIKAGLDKNMPTQRALDGKWLEVKETSYKNPRICKIARTTLVTGKGQIFFVNKFLKEYKEVVEKAG